MRNRSQSHHKPCLYRALKLDLRLVAGIHHTLAHAAMRCAGDY